MQHQHDSTTSCTTQSASRNVCNLSPHGPHEAKKIQIRKKGKRRLFFEWSQTRGFELCLLRRLRKKWRGGGKEGEKKEAVDRQARKEKRKKKNKIVRYILFFSPQRSPPRPLCAVAVFQLPAPLHKTCLNPGKGSWARRLGIGRRSDTRSTFCFGHLDVTPWLR